MPDLSPPPSALLDGASLFLDFDGTLVDFVVDPASVRVADSLRDLLIGLSQRLDGRLAILSGRPLDDLTNRIAVGPVAMAGSHGLERRSADGRVSRAAVPAMLPEAQAKARRFAQSRDLLLECKPFGIALHYRGADQAEGEVEEFASRLAADSGLELQRGKCVRELRAPGAHKGDAVRAFMAEPPFRVGSPVVVGDDLTDEHAFEAAAELGGCGILVGPARSTAARFRLPDVDSTLAWLGGRR